MGRKQKIQTDALCDDCAVAFLSGIYGGLNDSQKQEVATLFAHGFSHISKTGLDFLRDCPDLFERVHSIDSNIIL